MDPSWEHPAAAPHPILVSLHRATEAQPRAIGAKEAFATDRFSVDPVVLRSLNNKTLGQMSGKTSVKIQEV